MSVDTVSVTPLVILARHYGSEYAMADYRSNTFNLYLTASYKPTQAISLTGSMDYNISRGELDQVIMPDVTDRLWNDEKGETDLQHQDFTFDQMHELANLDYQMLNLHLGISYLIRTNLYLTLDGEYVNFKDKEGYVFGDESGSLLMVRTGIKYSF